ncbi:MAG TPA: FAD binding domain-containing protein [Acetobacteraceae bacterium]|nr:FAD binding domain-containing protein [Acetobacteraceae bacterium]
MTPFSYETAASEADAIEKARTGGRYIAGGTTLIDLMREEIERPARLIDINKLPLGEIREEADGLVIGALTKMAEVAAHPAAARVQPLLIEALLEGASPQLRNMASIGGNLMQRTRCVYFRTLDAPCNKRVPGSGCAAREGFHRNHAIFGTSEYCVAVHPSDLGVALVALGATIRTKGPEGSHEFPVDALYRLPLDTPHLEHRLLPGELITEIRVPHGAYARRARYLKMRDRASYEFALVSVEAALDIADGCVREARLSVGGVGTKP